MNVRTLCLGALIHGPATGYEIRKLFEEGYFSFFQRASLGSIYPALTKLTEDGFVTFSEEQQAARPDKKIYQLTDAGRAEFSRTLISTQPGMEQYVSDIVFMLCYSTLLPKAVTIHLLDTYRQRYMDEITRLDGEYAEEEAGERDGPCDPGLEFVRGLGLAVDKAVVEYIDDNREAFLSSYNSKQRPSGSSDPAD